MVSRLGTQLTAFGIALTVLDQNDSVTQFSLAFFASIAPEMTLSLAAGVVVDRWNRRCSDAQSYRRGSLALALYLLYTNETLEFPILVALIASRQRLTRFVIQPWHLRRRFWSPRSHWLGPRA